MLITGAAKKKERAFTAVRAAKRCLRGVVVEVRRTGALRREPASCGVMAGLGAQSDTQKVIRVVCVFRALRSVGSAGTDPMTIFRLPCVARDALKEGEPLRLGGGLGSVVAAERMWTAFAPRCQHLCCLWWCFCNGCWVEFCSRHTACGKYCGGIKARICSTDPSMMLSLAQAVVFASTYVLIDHILTPSYQMSC